MRTYPPCRVHAHSTVDSNTPNRNQKQHFTIRKDTTMIGIDVHGFIERTTLDQVTGPLRLKRLFFISLL